MHQVRNIVLCCSMVACSHGAAEGIALQRPPSVTSTNGTPVEGASAAQSQTIKRTLVASGDIANMPGFESRMYLIEYPPATQAEPHVHTEQAVGFVLTGRFESAYGDGAVSTVHAGEGFVELPHEAHRFRNPDAESPLRFVIAGTYRKGEPLLRTVADKAEPLRQSDSNKDQSVPVKTSPAGPVSEVKRTLLVQREIADMPGMESRLYLMEFPPSAESKLHVHTAQGIGYVLEGRFESAFGDGPTTLKRANEGFIDIPGEPHHFRNPDATLALRFVFAGTFHRDEPLFQLVTQ